MDFTKEELIARFTWIDYSVFVAVLAISAGIGLFFGCIKKIRDSQEFLMAGRSMSTFPVAMSLIARRVHENSTLKVGVLIDFSKGLLSKF